MVGGKGWSDKRVKMQFWRGHRERRWQEKEVSTVGFIMLVVVEGVLDFVDKTGHDCGRRLCQWRNEE